MVQTEDRKSGVRVSLSMTPMRTTATLDSCCPATPPSRPSTKNSNTVPGTGGGGIPLVVQQIGDSGVVGGVDSGVVGGVYGGVLVDVVVVGVDSGVVGGVYGGAVVGVGAVGCDVGGVVIVVIIIELSYFIYSPGFW